MSNLILMTGTLRRTVIRYMSASCSNAALYKNSFRTRYVNSFTGSVLSFQKNRETNCIPMRLRHTEKEEDDSDSENDEVTVEDVGKDFKVLKVRVNSLRADLVLKAALGMARNKVESAFYRSKVRLNGRKLLKKSAQVKTEDEVDVVRGTSKLNPKFLIVSRVKVLSYSTKDEKYTLFVQCFRALTIENYPDDPFKLSETT